MSASSPPVYSNLSRTQIAHSREVQFRSGRGNLRVSGCRLTFCAKRLARPAAVGAHSLRSGIPYGSAGVTALHLMSRLALLLGSLRHLLADVFHVVGEFAFFFHHLGC